ncbi:MULTISPECIES: MFS transporter [Pseudomonas]|uniref:MFS transporter n=1 Tax=Pseudomonas putida S13.1.2 TaxID=1384061 RepID=A0AAU8RWM7_PSEPU|nr:MULTISPECIES: MFS transporter [Pseudomonas]AJQ47127.1 MFS transporter [Pseudomonas putida S13.1.2]
MTGISKWHVLIGGFIAYLFDAMEIILLTVALPVIRQDLGFSLNEAGAMASATLLGIGVSGVATGWYSDNFGRRNALLASLAIFGVLTCFFAQAHELYLLMALRFVSGLGLGGVWTILSAYIVETWPPKQRARAISFVISAFPIGAIVAALAAKYMLPEWRSMFLLSGVSVLLPILYVYFLIPESPAWQAQRHSVAEATSRISVREIFAPALLRYTLLGSCAASFALLGSWGVSTWLPTYLMQDRGLGLAAMTSFMAVLHLGNFVGLNIFGFIADRIGKRLTIVISLLLTSLMAVVYVYTPEAQWLIWIGAAYAFFMVFAGLFGSYFSEMYPIRVRTLGAGFCFNAGRGLAAFAPVLLSGIASFYSLAAGLMVCAGFYVISAIFVIAMPQNPVMADDGHKAEGVLPGQEAIN